MARLRPLLTTLATLQARELRELTGAGTNHFVVFALGLFALQPAMGPFLPGIVGLLVLIPASIDPLRRIPSERLALIPLSRWDRVRLRGAALLMQPAVVLALALMVVGGGRFRGVGFLLLLLAAGLLTLRAGWDRWLPAGRDLGPLRRLPPLPGRLGPLVSKNLRELLITLDAGAALLLAVTGAAYRGFAQGPVGDAPFGLALLVALTLSTRGQRLFSLEGRGASVRYKLLPLRGWEVLLAKDAAFLLLLGGLTLPLDLGAGLGAGLAILTVGHRASVHSPAQERPWRFAAGGGAGESIVQVMALAGAALAVHRAGAWALVPCLGLWAASLAWFGRSLEKNPV